MEKIRWTRAILNGISVWVLAFIIAVIPGTVIGITRGFQLGAATTNPDPEEMQTQITRDIDMFYADPLVSAGLILLTAFTALLIFWRARVVAKGTGAYSPHNGLVVGAVPAILHLLFDLLTARAGVETLLTLIVYLGAGVLGGYLVSKQSTVATSSG